MSLEPRLVLTRAFEDRHLNGCEGRRGNIIETEHLQSRLLDLRMATCASYGQGPHEHVKELLWHSTVLYSQVTRTRLVAPEG